MSTAEQAADPTDLEFINLVTDLAISLGKNTHTDIQQQNFFRLADLPRKRLPKGSPGQIAENFLAVTISIISMKESSLFALKAVRVLHTFLRYDQSVFQVFRPNKPLLRKMDLEPLLMSQNNAEVEASLNLAYFLLRYHRAVDYGDFTDNAYAIQRIRRHFDYKVWLEIEELSGSHQDLSGNFTEFKTVTQKALQEIVAHLERISAESENRINHEAKALSQRVNGDIAALNSQIANYQDDKNGLQSENYKKLLDLLMQLDNKMKQTNQTMMGDLRQEFVSMLNQNDQGKEQALKNNNEQLYLKIGDLEGKMGSAAELDELRKELEKIIQNRFQLQQDQYSKVLEIIDGLDKKSQNSFTRQINELKQQIEETMNGRAVTIEKSNQAQTQKVLEMLQALEGRLDQRNVEIVRDMMAEIDGQESKTAKMLDASNERALNLINQLAEQLGAKNSELVDQTNNIQREFQKLINERSRQLEAVQQTNQQRVLELIVDLEKRMTKAIQEQLQEYGKNTERALDENKDHNLREIKSLNERVVENMVELEKRMGQRQNDINSEFKRDFQAILDEKIARQEGLTNENYKKTLQLLLELEKRMDTRQGDLLSELRNDFAKVVSQLDSSQMMRELEESFGRKIKTVEQALIDQERNLSNTFDGLIRQADQQIQKTVSEAIRQNEQELERQVDDKIADVSGKVRRSIDQEVKKAKDNLTAQIEQAIDLQQRGMQGMIKNSIDESRSGFERQVDKVVREMNGKMIEVIDQRMEDSQGSVGRIVDLKIRGELQRSEEDVGAKVRESMAALWAKTEKELNNLDAQTKRNLDTKMDITSLQNRMNDELQNQSTNFSSQITDLNVELQRAFKRDIEKATQGMVEQNTSSVDDGTKLNIDRLRNRMEQIEQALEDERRSTNKKLSETKHIIDKQAEERIANLTRLFEKLLNDSQQSLDQQFKVIIHDKIEENRRATEKETDARLDSKIQTTMKKFNTDLTIQIQSQSQNDLETLKSQFTDQLSRLDQKSAASLKESVRNLLDDMNMKLNQLNDNLNNIQGDSTRELDQKLAALQIQGAGSNPEEIKKAVGGLQSQFQEILDSHESQLSTLTGKVNAFDGEIDSMMEIKISNQIRTIKQSLNERMQQVTDDLSAQTNKQSNELKDQMNNYEVSIHNLKMNTDQYGHKIDKIEGSLSEQVDMLQGLNDRVAQQVERSSGMVQGFDKRVQDVEARFTQIVLELKNKAGEQGKVDELQEIVALLQSNDLKQGSDIKFLKTQMQTEIKAKVELILRNRDDLLKRVEEAEKEMEKMGTDANQRISRAEQRIESQQSGQQEKIRQLTQAVQELSNDVHSQIDRAIRDLETSDLRLQKEINDLGDSYKVQVKDISDFKVWVANQLQTEFEKINANFTLYASTMDGKEKRLQAQVDKMKQEVDHGMEQIRVALQKTGGAGGGNDQKTQAQIDTLSDVVRKQSHALQQVLASKDQGSTDTKAIKELLQQVKDLEQRMREAEQQLNLFSQFIYEQSMDKVKLVNSKTDNTCEHKFEAMEWMARYMKFLPPQIINKINKDWKALFYTSAVSADRKEMANTNPLYSTGVDTILLNLRNYKTKVEAQGEQAMEVSIYDHQNSLQLGILENILINDLNVEIFIKMGGVSDVVRIMQEQPCPSEMDHDAFEFNEKFVNKSFRPCLKVLMQAMRDPRAVMEIMIVAGRFERILQIAEEMQDEEVVLTQVRSIKLIVRGDEAFDLVKAGYPSMAEFLCQTLSSYSNSPMIIAETLLAFDYLLSRPHYIKLVAGHWIGKIAGLKTDPSLKNSFGTIDSILLKLSQK